MILRVKRGGHRHKKTWQFLICLNGSCELIIINKKKIKKFPLEILIRVFC